MSSLETGDERRKAGGGTASGESEPAHEPVASRLPPLASRSFASHLPPPAARAALPVVHAVTDDIVLASPEFLERARVVMRALEGRGAVHLRGALVSTARRFELACALRDEQERTGCWLVVNDRVDIALASGARAVQLTSRSMPVADARALAPALRLGASVHTGEEARAAADARADWIVAGHVFSTASHPGTPGRGVGFMQEILAASPLPCIAIGGIRPRHVAALRARGVHGVAAISGIWGADDAERAASEYLSAYDDQRGS